MKIGKDVIGKKKMDISHARKAWLPKYPLLSVVLVDNKYYGIIGAQNWLNGTYSVSLLAIGLHGDIPENRLRFVRPGRPEELIRAQREMVANYNKNGYEATVYPSGYLKLPPSLPARRHRRIKKD